MKNKTLLIAGNENSILTKRFKQLFVGKFDRIEITSGIKFDLKHIIGAFFKTKRLLKELKPDMIVLYQLNLTAFIVALAKKRSIPTLAVAIGSDVLVMPKRGFVFKAMLRYILKSSDAFNAVCPYLIEQMRQYAPKNANIVLANLGIELVKPATKENIVYSNRLHSPLYRIDDIIRAFANFVSKPEYVSWRLVVAANGREEELLNLVKELKIESKVSFVGWLSPEKNKEYYAKSKIYVSIPCSDGLPNSLMEAMSAECLTIVSDLPSYKGLIANGKNCLVVSDEEIAKADYIEKVLQMNEEELRLNNQQFLSEYADIETNRRKYWEIVDELLQPCS